MKKLKKGSFTIEAALLMPLILMVLMGLLYLDFFVHNRAWLTAAACESAHMRRQSVEVWKVIKKTETYMKKQIFRVECLGVPDFRVVRT